MPILGADMQAGTLVAWHKQPGDRVHKGDIIATVETDKAAVDVEAFLDGVVEKLLVAPDTEVPVGTPLAIIREEGAPAPAHPMPAAPLPGAMAPTPAPEPLPAVVPPAGAPVSPAARVLATKNGIDLAAITGTGPGGRIQLRDVEQAVANTRPVTSPTGTDRQTRMRQAIAAAMERSNREIPQFQLLTTIEMTRALDWLRDQNEKRPLVDRLLYSVLFIRAVAKALREVPELNAVWSGDSVELRQDIHVGVAIFLRNGGLVAPALHHADRQTVDQLMRNLRDLVLRARAGSLRSSEMSEPTVTVTSLGDEGAEAAFGLIFPPQAALVGFGRVSERPWCSEGEVVSRPLVTATLSADHRVADGHRGSLFLAAVDRYLQEPSQL